MKLTRIAIVLAVLASVSYWITQTQAKDSEGCDGLGDYRKEMLKIGRDYLKALDEDGLPLSREVTTYSTDDWTALAEDALEVQRDLKDVDPPAFAEGWHALKVQRAGLSEQLAMTVATGGLMMALAFGDQFDANDAAADKELAEIAKTCADFAAFEHDWQALDGDIDGTPVATPTD